MDSGQKQLVFDFISFGYGSITINPATKYIGPEAGLITLVLVLTAFLDRALIYYRFYRQYYLSVFGLTDGLLLPDTEPCFKRGSGLLIRAPFRCPV